MLRRLQPNVRLVAALPLALLVGCASDEGGVPTFEVNPFWPQPLEYPQIFGPIAGITIAPDGNILVVTRSDQANFGGSADRNVDTNTSNCCRYSAPVLEFTPDGTLVRQWGGPGADYPWPASPRGIGIDPDGNVWIGGGPVAAAPAGGGGGGGGGGGAPAGPPPPPPAPQYDGFILKFTREGEHIATFGQAGPVQRGNTSMTAFAGPNDFAFDGDVAYVADGYGNNRVAIVNIETGEITGVIGAHGNTPSDEALPPYTPGQSAPQFRSVTCVELNGDLLYVCDRGNNRVQVFNTDGEYQREIVVAPNTLGNGSVADIAFSPNGNFMYVADGMNERVHIVEVASGNVLTTWGVGGRQPSEFRELGGIVVDEDGNVYTAEDGQGRRIQKFTFLGNGAVTAEHQGPLWPDGAAAAE